MSGLTPYLLLPATAREALTFYKDVFGGELALHTNAEFSRTDGPADAIAHGSLSGAVTLFAADAGPGDETVDIRGVMFSLLGAAYPSVLEGWFAALSEGGEVIDPLSRKPWGDYDGQVRDRFGVTWLIGYPG